jgi:hypothetical protein
LSVNWSVGWYFVHHGGAFDQQQLIPCAKFFLYSFGFNDHPSHAIGKEQGKVLIHCAPAGITLVIPKAGLHHHVALKDSIPLLNIKCRCVSDVVKPRGAMIVQGLDKGGQPAVLVAQSVRPEGKGVWSLNQPHDWIHAHKEPYPQLAV